MLIQLDLHLPMVNNSWPWKEEEHQQLLQDRLLLKDLEQQLLQLDSLHPQEEEHLQPLQLAQLPTQAQLLDVPQAPGSISLFLATLLSTLS